MSEEMKFEAEVSQLLQLMIHSLYSNPEIFLRELISNGSDACDKLRFEAVSDASLLETDHELGIVVAFDADASTITVTDNGIGMSREEVVQNIGTIAKSGTKQFLDSLTGDQKTDSALIGQFGVGFYSSFVIADKVELQTRRAGLAADEGVRWISDGTGGYTLESVAASARGTTVTLHVKEEHKSFLDHWTLRGIVKKYSDHVTFPIKMLEQLPPPSDPNPDDETEQEPPKEPELEQINAASALWARAESMAPKHGIKLFVQRVFIMDDAEKLMPRYLRFVRGLVDSNDLPLNVSREILQDNKVIDSIRRASVKKVLSMLANMAEKQADDYKEFWSQFGNCLKEAPGEDMGNREEVAKLYRFDTTHSAIQGELTYAAANNSPHLEIFRDKGIEVLLMHDRVDEWMMGYLNEYDGKSFVSIAKGDLDLDGVGADSADADAVKAAKEKQAAAAEPLIKRIKVVLEDDTSDVRASSRLTSSPACVVMGEHDMALHMQQLLKQAGHDMPNTKPVLEVNPSHPILELLDREQDDDRFANWSRLLLDQAMLAEGGQLADGAGFVKRMNEMFMAMQPDTAES